VLHDRKVVRDEEVRQPQLVLQVLQEVDDLRLHGDVESGDGLVEHHELRIRRQRARDADALPLPSGELVRIALPVVGREADFQEELRDALVAIGFVEVVDDQRLGDDRPHGHARIQRRIRILKDDLHVPADAAQVAGVEVEHVLPFELDGAGGRLDEPEDAAPDGGLPRSRFAHEAERLASSDAEADAVDGFDVGDDAPEDAALDGKVLLQIPHDHERLAHPLGQLRRPLRRGLLVRIMRRLRVAIELPRRLVGGRRQSAGDRRRDLVVAGKERLIRHGTPSAD
jgi:hypothetical protein